MLQDAVATKPLLVYLSGLQHSLVRTQTDYSSASTSAGGAEIMKKLLDKGVIVAQVETVTYPKISAHLSKRDSCMGGGSTTQTMSLDTLPSSNEFSGLIVFTYCNGTVERQPFKGTVRPDGSFDFPGRGFEFTAGWHGHYSESDGSVVVNDYAGSAPAGQKVEVRWYQYSFAPDVEKRIVQSDSGSAIAGGDISVKELSELRLVAETEATCRFSWFAPLNSTAAAILATDKESGTGSASFSKKPDGSWSVDHWALR